MSCPWCARLARNGCEPEVCGHLGGGSMALAAQKRVEEWKYAALPRCRGFRCDEVVRTVGDYCDGCCRLIEAAGTFGT
jgi:hypothetical protein